MNNSSKHDYWESANILHERTEDDWTYRIYNAKTYHHITDLMDSQRAADVSLLRTKLIKKKFKKNFLLPE